MYKTLVKCFAALLSFVQLLFMNVAYGSFGCFEMPEKPATEVINDINGDSSMDNTIIYAKRMSNVPQGIYTDSNRTAYKMTNSETTLTHDLKGDKTATLKSVSGETFLQDTMDVYYVSDGKTYFASDSSNDGRVNTIRLGEYYYECHVREFDFGDSSHELFKTDKTYHVYADRLYQQISLVASKATTALEEYGVIVKLPVKDVLSCRIKTADGYIEQGEADAEYVAFDVKDAGVVGFIMPSDGSAGKIQLTKDKKFYTLTMKAAYTAGSGINAFDETGGYELNSVTFGQRIWTDTEHSYDGIEKAARLERSPLEGISVTGTNARATYIGYEALRGTYKFTIDGTDFTSAYKNTPDFHFFADITVKCDDTDRDIYIRMNGSIGCLEAAALLDENKTLIPVDVQVSKNFQGDGGEGFFSLKDYQYGDSIYPLSLKARENLSYRVLNLYQNWGKHPLKQISSIEFFVSYYHLSTGVTETNCIAPYFVAGKDGWTLPDFRGFSSEFWESQPQHNSVGRLYFAKYDKSAFKTVLSESTGAFIRSSGLCYTDMDYSYVSDCGSYEYNLRHVEMPQTDENRTYYTVDLKFLRDMTFEDFKNDFSFFSFDGRFVKFDKTAYLDENNQIAAKELPTSKNSSEYIKLGSVSPFFTYYDVCDEDKSQLDNSFGSNFALIVKDSEMVIGGEKKDIGFGIVNKLGVINSGENKVLNTCALTLDAKKISFKAGDSIKINLILLPWGEGTEQSFENVLRVREDSALNPLTVNAQIGTAIEDDFIPMVRCENNKAKFTVTGGRNNCAVRVCGFTQLNCPTIRMSTDGGEYNELELASVNGYDGYTVYYNEDGTYDFSFIYEAADPYTVYSFEIQ